MSISIGQQLPTHRFTLATDNGLQPINTADLFANQRVLIFGVPGAFTPVCNQHHLPGYLNDADTLLSCGIDRLICVSVNDPFVMRAWGEAHHVGDKILLLPDYDGMFIKTLGLLTDAHELALGMRSKRFALIARNGVVENIQIEDKITDHDASGAPCMLSCARGE